MAPPGCRFCGAPLEKTLVDLGRSPPCQAFPGPDQLNRLEAFYPLLVWICERCYLVQLEEYVAPEDLFGEYAYFSSHSTTWLAHARAYAAAVVERFHLGHESRVVELASNDGYLLQHFVARGIPVLGVEPAANVAAAAVAKGVPTLVRFFGRVAAADLLAEGKAADLLVGNNVLAHVPDLNDFVEGMRVLLRPEGVITMEFPHLLRLIAGGQFDTIYHEHYSYFSFWTVEQVFAAHGLTLFDVEELPTHGGSLRIYARHAADARRPVGPAVDALRALELEAGINRMAFYQAFAGRAEATRQRLRQLLIGLKQEGKSIVGYGAPGKSTTLLNYCGIRTDILDYTVDQNPYKQGRFTPGTHVPIHPPARIFETRPDYVLILPWNLESEIMAQMAGIRAWGGRFIVPVPEPRVE